ARTPGYAALLLTCIFSFSASISHRYLHSFPTRRSSDLLRFRPGAPQGSELVDGFRRAGAARGCAGDRHPRCRAVRGAPHRTGRRSEEHTSELQSHLNLVCRLLLEKKNKKPTTTTTQRHR